METWREKLDRPGAANVTREKRRRIKFKYEDLILFCFFGGLILATAAANWSKEEVSRQADYYLRLLSDTAALSESGRISVFLRIARQRLFLVFGAWLAGLTVYSVPIFCVGAGAAGGAIGLILSAVTIQRGVAGIFVFLMPLFPQAIFYGPVCFILMLWGGRQGGRLRLAGLCVLMVLALAGSACETWINPFFLRLAL